MPQELMPETPDAKQAERSPREKAATALLPLSFFQGKDLSPGTVCKVRIERVQEDQAEVSYVPHSEGDEEEMVEVTEEDYMS